MSSYKVTLKGTAKVPMSVMRANLETKSKSFETRISTEVDNFAADIQSYMKTAARWRDRTKRARQTLFARASSSGRTWQIIMGHGMPYGIYLEKSNGERFAIVDPTRAQYGPLIMERMRNLWGSS